MDAKDAEIEALEANLAEAERDRYFKQTDRALAYEMYEKEKARAEAAEGDARVMADALMVVYRENDEAYRSPLTDIAVERWRTKT